MVAALSASEMREIDRLMTEEIGVALLEMMELAGRNTADLARRMLSGSLNHCDIVVLAGPGNNGGGGLCAARHLATAGASVSVVLARTGGKLKPAPAHHLGTLRRIGLPIIDFSNSLEVVTRLREADLIIDALLGYNGRGAPLERIADAISLANESARPILSLDLPSGLDADTGTPSCPCIRASATLALGLPKQGLLTSEASAYVGRLWVGDIGIPPSLYSRVGIHVGAIFSLGSVIVGDQWLLGPFRVRCHL